MGLKVNGERVSARELIAEESRIQGEVRGTPDEGMSPAEVQGHARDRVVDRCLFRQEAKRRYPNCSPAELKACRERLVEQCGDEREMYRRLGLKQGDTEMLREVLREDLQVNRLMDKIMEGLPEVSGDDCFNHYMRYNERYSEPERINASHIVKNVDGTCDEATALAHMRKVQAELEAGGDFAELADKHSSCPGNGGELGFFARGQMVPEFEKVVFKMSAGDVSDIFLSPFGYHIVKVHERLPGRIQPFEDVLDAVREELQGELESERIQSFVKGLREQAKIEVS